MIKVKKARIIFPILGRPSKYGVGWGKEGVSATSKNTRETLIITANLP